MNEVPSFVSRAGVKLAHALDAFKLDPAGFRCADFGCNIGGFTDCLLQRGAGHVIAIDTGYGVLDWKLRNDERVEVRERTNVLHAELPEKAVDLLVSDVGWTPQARVVPAALPWLVAGGRILTLVQPHYEQSARPHTQGGSAGHLDDASARAVLKEVVDAMPEFGARVIDEVDSPLRGAKSSRRKQGGNIEFLLLLEALRPPVCGD